MSDNITQNELKLLKFLHKRFDGEFPSKEEFFGKLKKLGFDKETINKDFIFFVNNFRENGDYENIETPVRGEPLLSQVVDKIINTPNIPLKQIESLIDNKSVMGDYFKYDNGWASPPWVIANENEITIGVNDEDYMKYFSGIDDSDDGYETYYYNYAFHPYGNRDEDVMDDELNYMHYYLNSDTLKIISNIAKLFNQISLQHKISNDKLEEGELKNFIEKYIPHKSKEIFDDYLMELSYAISDAKAREVKECYDSNITYHFKNHDQLTLKWSELKDMITKFNLVTLSDMKDAKINGDSMDLETCYQNAYPEDEDLKRLKEVMENEFEKIFDDLIDTEDVEQKNLLDNIDKSNEILKSLGFKYYYGDKYKKQIRFDKTRSEIVVNKYNPYTDKFNITITYSSKLPGSTWGNPNRVTKEIPSEDLSVWVTQLPLDKQMEGLIRDNIYKVLFKEGEKELYDNLLYGRIIKSLNKKIEDGTYTLYKDIYHVDGTNLHILFDKSKDRINLEIREGRIHVMNWFHKYIMNTYGLDTDDAYRLIVKWVGNIQFK